MEQLLGHAVPIRSIKASQGGGWTVSGYVSTFGNVDHGGDVIARGAFDDTLAANSKVRFLFGHDSHQILGTTKLLRPDEKGLYGEFQISKTALGADVHTLLKDEAIDSFSIGYIPKEFEFDDQMVRILKSVDLLEVSLVAIPMNDQAQVTAFKERLYADAPPDETDARAEFDALEPGEKIALYYRLDGKTGLSPEDEQKAVWSTAYINDLPDSAFAVILGGGSKDGDGRTTPRSLRKLPHHNAEGGLDQAHLNNALSREPQTDMPDAAHSKAKSHLNSHKSGKSHDEFPTDLSDLTYEEHAESVLDEVKVFLERSTSRLAARAANGRKAGAAFYERLQSLRSDIDSLLAMKGQPVGELPTDALRLRLAIARRKAELDGIRPHDEED